MFSKRGQISSGGSAIRREWRAPHNSTVMRKLEAAGAITIGRLNVSEFAAHPTGENEHFGACRNPWGSSYVTGGSSSGSGAAVAARIVFGALGSDTGGSIRLPRRVERRLRPDAELWARQPLRRDGALVVA